MTDDAQRLFVIWQCRAGIGKMFAAASACHRLFQDAVDALRRDLVDGAS